MPHTIALTGATGFIGGALARRLVAGGWQVRALVRPRSRHKPLPDGVELLIGSLEDEASLRRLVRGAAAVVHCAGVVRGACAAVFERTNTAGAERLARVAASERPAPRFVLMSSLAARQPGLSPYARSKRDGETAVAGAAGKQMPWIILRPPAVYGPGDREMLPLFRCMARGIAPVWNAPGARFSLLFVTDLADAVADCVGCAGSVDRATFELHDGHPRGYSVDEVIEAAARAFGRPVRCLPIPVVALEIAAYANLALARCTRGAPMLTPWKLRELRYPHWVCDNATITAATRWAPSTPLEAGLRQTVPRPAPTG